jgi:hypothetical protein
MFKAPITRYKVRKAISFFERVTNRQTFSETKQIIPPYINQEYHEWLGLSGNQYQVLETKDYVAVVRDEPKNFVYTPTGNKRKIISGVVMFEPNRKGLFQELAKKYVYNKEGISITEF